MKTFAVVVPAVAIIFSVFPSALAAPASSPAKTLEARGNHVYVGYSIPGDGIKFTWKEGQDICKGDFLTFGNRDVNFCDKKFTIDGNNLVYKQCGFSAPELWSLDSNDQPSTKLSTCSYGYNGNGKVTDHRCGNIWQFPYEIEYTCDYPL